MDHPDSPGGSGRTPRKELQGPRPAPLKVRKDSHKIKKPPVAPPPATQNQQPPPPPHQPPRQPVIIYTVSPKVIHTQPSEFMTLVQRLTGPDATSSSSPYSSQQHSSFNTTTTTTTSSSFINDLSSYNNTTHSMAHGGISPAARYASIENTKMQSDLNKIMYAAPSDHQFHKVIGQRQETGIIGGSGDGGHQGTEKTVYFPGILSPGPGSLPPISPNLFSPYFYHHDPNNNNTLQHGNTSSSMEGSYLPSPFATNLFTPSPMFSPSTLDVLQRVWDT